MDKDVVEGMSRRPERAASTQRIMRGVYCCRIQARIERKCCRRRQNEEPRPGWDGLGPLIPLVPAPVAVCVQARI